MASIPLPALDVRPPQQTDPLQAMGRLVQMKGMLQNQALQGQELQRGQIQLQDQQATTKAMHEWDGGDVNQLPSLVLKHGGSATAVFGMKNQIISYQKNLAEMTKDQLANEATKNDMIAGHIDKVKGMDPADQPAGFEAAKADLVQRGYMDPKAAQAMQYQGPDQLDMLEKMYQSHSQQVEQALKKQQTVEATARAGQATAETGKLTTEANFYQQNPAAGAPGVPAETVSLMDYMRKPMEPGEAPHTPSNFPAWKAKQEAIQTAPEKEAVAAAEGAARANVEIGKSRVETSDKQYQTAIGADERLNRMEKSYTDAVTHHNQQAMLALLTDHIGMTLGLQKGARITKDIINEAAQSQPWLAKMEAKFDSDGYLSGVNLSPGQMKQMLDLGYSARENAWDSARSTSQLYGSAPPPNAAAVYNKRDPKKRIYDNTTPGTDSKNDPLGIR